MILRDPVHGLVSFESEESSLIPILLDTPEVQRLRRIRQLGLTSLVYPGADHTRFAHAIGAAHVMVRFVARLREEHDQLPFWQRLTSDRARDAIVAALLHDLGHGPFSHLFETALPDGPRHEEWTSQILLDPDTGVHRALAEVDGSLPDRVARLVHGQHDLPYLAGAVSGTFDVDRCDYLLRDAHFTGVGYGRYDLDWLLRSLRFGFAPGDQAPPLAIDGVRGLPAIESFILARLFMFQQVYFHKASRSSEWMLGRVLGRMRELLLDGARIDGVPPGLESLARNGSASTRDYLALDDAILTTSLARFSGSNDQCLADLAGRLHRRQLFKTRDLYGSWQESGRPQEALNRAREVAQSAGLDPNHYVGLDVARDVPYDEAKESLSVIMPDGTEARPGDVSFVLGRLRGEEFSRVRLIFAPELREGIGAVLA